MNSIRLFFAFLVVQVAVTSCNEFIPDPIDEINSNNVSYSPNRVDGLYAEAGRLIFPSRMLFSRIMIDTFRGKNDGYLNEWEKQFDFNSLRSVFLDDSIGAPLGDDYINTVLNKDGIIQIGLRIYKLTKDKVSLLSDKNKKTTISRAGYL